MKKNIGVFTFFIFFVMIGSVFAYTPNGNNNNYYIDYQWQDQRQNQTQFQETFNQNANDANAFSTSNSSSNSNSVAVNDLTIKDSFNEEKPIRALPESPKVSYVGLAPSFVTVSDDPGPNFIKSESMIWVFGGKVSKNAIAGNTDVKINVTVLNKDNGNENVEDVYFMLPGDRPDGEIGIGTVNTDEDGVNSSDLAIALANKAREMGASKVVLLSEGVSLNMTSSGWGIGAAYTYATVDSKASGSGGAGTGGTGYATGSGKYEKLPYLTFGFFK